MVKFQDSKHHDYVFNLSLTDVSTKTSPFKELVSGNYDDITFSNDGGRYPLSGAVRLQIKMNNVGSFIFFLNYPEEKIPIVIEDIKNLKASDINSLGSMINTVESLFRIMSKYNLLFAMYKQDEKYPLDLAICKAIDIRVPIFNLDKSVAVPEVELPKVETAPSPVKEEKVEEQPAPKVEDKKPEKKEKKEAPKFLKAIGEFFAPIKKDYLHFGFVLISALLTGFALSVGVYNSFDGKPIAIFFYVCAAVGAGLNGLVNFDTFKGKEFKQSFYVLTGIATILGTILAMVGFVIFYAAQQNIPETIPAQFTIIAVSFVISLVILAISTVIGVFISRREKQKDEE